MKIRILPIYLITIGFICVVLGVVLPFLIIIKWIQSTLWLNFLAYGFSVVGLILGVVGIAWTTRLTLHQREFKMRDED